MLHIHSDGIAFDLEIVHKDCTVAKVGIGKELQDNLLSGIIRQRDFSRSEDARVIAICPSLGIGCQISECQTVVSRNLHGKITAVGSVGVVEVESVGSFIGQFDDGRVDKCSAYCHSVVVHTEHLVAAIFIYAPNIIRIFNSGNGSGAGVVPAFRDGVDRLALKVFAPWQAGDCLTPSIEKQRVAPFAQAVFAAVALHHDFVLGRSVQYIHRDRIAGIVNSLPWSPYHFINGDVVNIKSVSIYRGIVDGKIVGIFRHHFRKSFPRVVGMDFISPCKFGNVIGCGRIAHAESLLRAIGGPIGEFKLPRINGRRNEVLVEIPR